MMPSKEFIRRWSYINLANVNLASDLTTEFYVQAIEIIDLKMGKGYSKEHPEHVDLIVNCMGTNYSTIELCSKLVDIDLHMSHQVEALVEFRKAIDHQADILFEIRESIDQVIIGDHIEKLDYSEDDDD
jgi:hypothetical protein